jgi:hypothetical protein
VIDIDSSISSDILCSKAIGNDFLFDHKKVKNLEKG